MKNRIKILLPTILLGISSIYASTPSIEPSAFNKEDTVGYFGLSLSTQLTDKLGAYGFFAKTSGDSDFSSATLGLMYYQAPNLAFSFDYNGYYYKTGQFRPDPRDERVRGAVTFNTTVNDFHFSHRSMVERRWVDVGTDWRYRPQFTVTKPVTMGETVLTPFFTAEGFYNASQGKWNMFTYQAGVTIPLSKNLQIQPSIAHAKLNVQGANDANVGSLILFYQF